MRVLSVNNYDKSIQSRNISPSYGKYQAQHTLQVNNKPSFYGLDIAKKINNKVLKALDNFDNFSIDEYKKLSFGDKLALRLKYKLYSETIYDKNKEIELIHDLVPKSIKNGLDKKYGENNYTVITIGRSISSIGKVLSYKIGEDRVFNIPMSKASRYSYKSVMEQENIFPLKKYLEDIGLTKQIENNDNKHFVLMDYCISGFSLKGANALFQDYLYPNFKNKFHTEDIKSLLEDEKLRTNCLNNLFISKYKPLSFVKRCFNLADTPNSVVNTKNVPESIRLTWFRFLDNEQQHRKHKLSILKDTTPIVGNRFS